MRIFIFLWLSSFLFGLLYGYYRIYPKIAIINERYSLNYLSESNRQVNNQTILRERIIISFITAFIVSFLITFVIYISLYIIYKDSMMEKKVLSNY